MTSGNVSRRKLAICTAIAAALGTASHGLAVTMTPLSGITGWNGIEIYGSSTGTNIDFDALNQQTFFANSAPSAPSNVGLPTTAFTSAANPGTTFQYQPFSASNALELNSDPTMATFGTSVQTATLQFSGVADYSNLAFLSADANGAATISYTLHFSGGATATGSFGGQDWGSGTATGGALPSKVERNYVPYQSLTQFGTMYQSFIYNNPAEGPIFDQYENDITVPTADQVFNLTSVTFAISGSTSAQWSIFAVSGATVPMYTYTGTDSTNPATFDNSSLNFQQNGSAAAFSNGTVALFDDTAMGSHSVSIPAAGVSPLQVQFNNSSTSYTINGPGSITGSGGLSVTGSGVVTLNNVNTYTGNTTINSGTLNLNQSASIASANIIVGSGGSFEVSDNSGTAGIGNTVTITGPGVTSTYSNPIPNGPTGALRGGDGVTSIWAGNVVVSGPSYIASGADGTLTLTGSISGTGPITFTGNTNDTVGATITLSPSVGNANTYSGETQLLPDVNVNVTNGTLLQLGADNGLVPTAD
jgi:autotransporter-associated beta strand protein